MAFTYKNFRMKNLILIAIFFLLNACSTQTFYIVRHAEKADGSDDPGLSPADIERGIVLEKYLAHKNLDTVFTSNFKRTVLTGLSVSLPESLPQISLDQSPKSELNSFIARLKNIHSNKSILVVGHTNTIPAIVLALSGQSIPEIPETVYNNMYIITIKGNQKDLQQTTYGR